MNFNPKYTLRIHEATAGSIPGSGRCPGGGQVNPAQYSCLKNPIDRGDWQSTVHRVAKSWTQVKPLSMHTCIVLYIYD